MNKRLTILGSIILLFLTVVIVLVGQAVLYLFREDYRGSPAYFSAYPDSGYYEINPETILASLDQGETDIFVPFFGNPDRDEPYYDSIAWTQSDYLKIANALSLEIWNEPLDLGVWRVIDMDLMQDCGNNPHGFHTFTITYYKDLGTANRERHYTTRLIEVYSWKGLVRWGSGAIFSTPLLLGWDGFNPNTFKITGDAALQVAEKNGGLNARLKANNSCMTIISVNQLSPIPHAKDWLVSYERADFYMHIDPYTGNFKILRTDQ